MSHPHTHDSHGSAGPVGPVADASVRIAAASDAPAVGLVQAVTWTQLYAGLLPDAVVATFTPEAFAKGWREALTAPPSPRHRLLVACAGSQVVGFAAVGPSTDRDAGDGDAELLVLTVHPQARHAGHGSRLLNAAVDTARGAGFTTVCAWLPPAEPFPVPFLEASGFAADGASRARVVGPDEGDLLTEVRLVAVVDDAHT